ncbi:TPA: thioredoxin-disulfide reductase, partial [Candidatus Sumerlaeota bacterium]|nr:thioredoxin-disulfide reductase [Candidatus Sumerlaeota bacterium]
MSIISEKVLIIGGGPAGLTAALYTARANLKPLVLEGPQPGGQLTITSDVENFPGFPEPQTGPELIGQLHQQAERFGARFAYESVQSIDLSRRPFTVQTDTQTIEASAVIVATGASARWLELPSEKALMGHGVSACATCDGFFFRGKEVVVVGGGDTALEEGLFLTRFCKRVTIIHRRDQLRGSKILQERALNHPQIGFLWDSVVDEIADPAQNKVTAVKVRNVKTGAVTNFPCDGVFLAIGHVPNTGFLKGQIVTD